MRDWLNDAAGERPEHCYLAAPTETVTFADADSLADSWAGGLIEHGVQPGSRVGLWASNSVPSLVAMFAIWRAGATVLLLNRRLTGPEASIQAMNAGAELVLGVEVPSLGVRTVSPADLPRGSVSTTDIDPSSTAWLVATSGSAGEPKLVRLSFANLEASAQASAARIQHTPDDVWLANLPLFHVGGAMIGIRCARERSTMALEPNFDAQRTADMLGEGVVTIASLVALTLEATLSAGSGRYDRTKAVLVGGGPVPDALLGRAVTVGLPALRTYGMTETCSQIATEEQPGGGMTALRDAEIRVVEGHIEVRGPMVSSGYEREQHRASTDWFRTDDMGEMDAAGRLIVLGRADTVIVTGGENVSPEEIERALKSHPGVSDAVVVGIPDPAWGTVLAAVYEGTAAAGELERHLRYRLAGFKLPKKWVRVESLPRTSIGKPDRGAALLKSMQA